jgi:hypothetical protein
MITSYAIERIPLEEVKILNRKGRKEYINDFGNKNF